jgi:type IV fimbrial biogenesis protein FimT
MKGIAAMGHHLRSADGRQPGRRAGGGFTMIELIVAIAIVSVLVGLAIPSFSSLFLTTRLSSYANELVGTALLARSEAIKQNADVRMCVSSDGTSCTAGNWNEGYLVECKSTDGATCASNPPASAASLVLARQPKTANGWKITEANGVTSITFKPTGSGATQAELKVCRLTPSLGNNERIVRVSTTGRPSVTKTALSNCS